jgi:hypothetical protein
MEEPKEIGQIDPESTIQTSGIETSIHQRVMPLDHHEPFALQTIHSRYRPSTTRLPDAIHYQRKTSGQQPAPENRGPEGEVGIRPPALVR